MSHQLVKFVKIGRGYSVAVQDRKLNPLHVVSMAVKFLLDMSSAAGASIGKSRCLGNGLGYFRGGS